MANLSPAPAQPAAAAPHAAAPHAAAPHAAAPHAAAPAAQHATTAQAGHATTGHATAQAGHAAAGHAAAGTSAAGAAGAGVGATATAGLLGGKALLITLAVLLAGAGAVTWSVSSGGGGGGGKDGSNGTAVGGGKALREPFDQAVQALAAAPGVRYQGDWNVEEYLNDVTVTPHGEKYGTSHLTGRTMESDTNSQDLLSIGGKDYSRWHASDLDLRLWTYDGLGDRTADGGSRLTQEMSLYETPADLAKRFSAALADRPRLPSAKAPETTDVNGVPALRADTTSGYLYVSRDAPYRFLRWEPPSAMNFHLPKDGQLSRAMEANSPLWETSSVDLSTVAPAEVGAMYDGLEKYAKDLRTARYGSLDFDKSGDSGVNCDAAGCHVRETVTAKILQGDTVVRKLSQVNVQLTVGKLSIDGRPAGSCSSGPQPLPVTGSGITGTLTCDDPSSAAVYQQVAAESQSRANAVGSNTYWDRAEDITIVALVLTASEVDQLLATVRQERSAAH
ncbi:hypothetical protein KCH_59470 [Kitasatospora cheerisanensis KCTC 2395]|uniref:Uncharacterized protein n=2 Tax=Kitasatospora cheerisanensis TaxID=81942 RepID=A0A066YLB0_9ACTN|nr:hypothetical protein KCH_59470 [Kitasatospora cheerisanensis KCTC 2395]